ncbi:hypothetical protein BDZ94DRAFT_1316144, partial [Collybia nuda]
MASGPHEFILENAGWDDVGNIVGDYGIITAISFSPNGEFLAIAGEAGLVVILETNDWQARHIFSTSVPIRALCWKPYNNGLFFVGCGNGDIMLMGFPPEATRLIHNFPGIFISISFSKDGSKLAVAFANKVFICCDINDERSTPTFHEIPFEEDCHIRNLHFANEKLLVVSLLDHNHDVAHGHSVDAPFAKLWNIQRHSSLQGALMGSAISPSGLNLAILSQEGINWYSITALSLLKTTALERINNLVTMHFMSENTIFSGSNRKYVIMDTIDNDNNPRIIDFQDIGPIIQALACYRRNGIFTLAIGARTLRDDPGLNGVIIMKEKRIVREASANSTSVRPTVPTPVVPTPADFRFIPNTTFRAAPAPPAEHFTQSGAAPIGEANQSSAAGGNPTVAPFGQFGFGNQGLGLGANNQGSLNTPIPGAPQAIPVQQPIQPTSVIGQNPPAVTVQQPIQPTPVANQAELGTRQATDPVYTPIQPIAVAGLVVDQAEMGAPQTTLPGHDPIQPFQNVGYGPMNVPVPAQEGPQTKLPLQEASSGESGRQSRRDTIVNKSAVAALVLCFAWAMHQALPPLPDLQAWVRQASERLPTIAFPNQGPEHLPQPSPSPLFATLTLTQTETTIETRTRTFETTLQSKATAGTVISMPASKPLTQTFTKAVTVEKVLTRTSTKTIQATMPMTTTYSYFDHEVLKGEGKVGAVGGRTSGVQEDGVDVEKANQEPIVEPPEARVREEMKMSDTPAEKEEYNGINKCKSEGDNGDGVEERMGDAGGTEGVVNEEGTHQEEIEPRGIKVKEEVPMPDIGVGGDKSEDIEQCIGKAEEVKGVDIEGDQDVGMKQSASDEAVDLESKEVHVEEEQGNVGVKVGESVDEVVEGEGV